MSSTGRLLAALGDGGASAPGSLWDSALQERKEKRHFGKSLLHENFFSPPESFAFGYVNGIRVKSGFIAGREKGDQEGFSLEMQQVTGTGARY